MCKKEGACNYFRIRMTNKKVNKKFEKMVVELYRSGQH